jgi:hypothetical protein
MALPLQSPLEGRGSDTEHLSGTEALTNIGPHRIERGLNFIRGDVEPDPLQLDREVLRPLGRGIGQDQDRFSSRAQGPEQAVRPGSRLQAVAQTPIQVEEKRSVLQQRW